MRRLADGMGRDDRWCGWLGRMARDDRWCGFVFLVGLGITGRCEAGPRFIDQPDVAFGGWDGA